MKALNSIMLSGREVLPLVEGGKGVGITDGRCSGAWAAAGGVGTFSGVNADSYDENGDVIAQVYHKRTRRERHEELIAYAISGGITQARIAHETAGGQGRVHLNVLWEMGGAERVLHGVLDGARELVHGVTCGAGMPYRLGEIAARYKIDYYPIVSSTRAFRALWKRAHHKFAEWLGGVVYEDPWRAGGHNGLSNSEDPETPEDPYPRVAALRRDMRSFGLDETPILMAGGVWFLRDWQDWIDNPELGPIAFQFGTRGLLTQESPIPDAWKRRLVTIKDGDVKLHRFSPTGFWASSLNNSFIRELTGRSKRQVPYSTEPLGTHTTAFAFGPRGRTVYMTAADRHRAEGWIAEGYVNGLRTPDSTLIFVSPEKANQIRTDQTECMGCLSECRFSNWSQSESGKTGRKADPRSFCIQKTLQEAIHGNDVENELIFSGHGAYRFGFDPLYSNGFIPTVKQLVERIRAGD